MNTSTCNPDLIDDFLADRLFDLQLAAFERHLDECDSCCAKLQQRTADESLWRDARSYLSSSDNVPHASSAGDTAGPDVSKRDFKTARSDAPLQLDFLAPTDDPRMLGRFAGYEISGVVGCGGMGIVLKGFDPALNRYAAIKVLAPHYASSGAARQRFAREAQAAAAVVHDNVIAIHGVSEFNCLPYLIMPYIKGQSLQKRIDRHGPLSTAEILRISMQTARGLAAAHDQGLVHRDIKPANILLPENVERVMITDFGLARAADDASLTRSGVIAGTPQYMSPEQAKGEGIDHRSDLFSLGSMMYAMATGHPPFRAETPYGILRRITDHPHRPVQEVSPDVPPWLCSIIDRLLAKDASERFASADEVASLLENCLAHVQQPTVVPLPCQLHSPHRPAIFWRSTRFLAAAALLLVTIVFAFTIQRSIGWFSTTESTANRPSDGTAYSVPLTASPLLVKEFSDNATNLPEATEADLRWNSSAELDQLEATLRELNQFLTQQPDEGTLP